jgi:hypothetical protein
MIFRVYVTKDGAVMIQQFHEFSTGAMVLCSELHLDDAQQVKSLVEQITEAYLTMGELKKK